MYSLCLLAFATFTCAASASTIHRRAQSSSAVQLTATQAATVFDVEVKFGNQSCLSLTQAAATPGLSKEAMNASMLPTILNSYLNKHAPTPTQRTTYHPHSNKSKTRHLGFNMMWELQPVSWDMRK
jgi:hypothetical protein